MDQQPPAPQNSPAPVTAAPAASALPGVPETWPGAFGIYKYSANAVKINVGAIVVMLLVTYVVAVPVQIKFRLIGDLIGFLVGGVTSVTLTMLYLAGVRGQRLSLGDALNNTWPLVLKMVGLTLLVTATLIASILLLVVPFLFVAPRLSLVNYFLVDKKLGVIESYKASWAATKGNSLKVWGLIGVSILFAALMLTIIGIPFALYLLVMYSASTAVLFEFLQKSSPASGSPAPAPATNPQPPAV